MNDYLNIAINNFNTYKTLADKAIAQLNDEELFKCLSDEDNSVAIIMQHMIGNARSRFTDFFTSDGEKPNRNRDEEFVLKNNNREQLLANWEDAWKLLFDLLYNMKTEELSNTVFIRAERQSALKAINRQIAHYAYHVGQIVFLAKHFKGKDWDTLSIAKGKSEEYNRNMMS
jgi:Protein of unknown function (DUF1572)